MGTGGCELLGAGPKPPEEATCVHIRCCDGLVTGGGDLSRKIDEGSGLVSGRGQACHI